MEAPLKARDSAAGLGHGITMHEAWHEIPGQGNNAVLIIADHASNHVPAGIALGVAGESLTRHIAWDIGVAPLAAALCDRLGCGAILGGVSRLVIDFNREEDSPSLVPLESDGETIPGNRLPPAQIAARLDRFWRPYHARVAAMIAARQPHLLVSLHSFTPQLRAAPQERRPWEVGILYNLDDRAARLAIPMLEAAGVLVGDQLPYSGRHLNATMNRHAERAGLAYLGIEMRQDLIGEAEGVARWSAVLSGVIGSCADAFASAGRERHARI